MSQSHSIQTRCHRDSSAAPRRSPITGWIRAVSIWFSRRRSYQDLRSLDDRLLDDVGISPEEVRQLGKPPLWP
jgi:uncharacterized protein YjiS (DUF1127 family)